MRNKWLHALRNKCAVLDWTKSRICSKHFENKYFDAQRKLKEIAIPTLFPDTATKTPKVSVLYIQIYYNRRGFSVSFLPFSDITHKNYVISMRHV